MTRTDVIALDSVPGVPDNQVPYLHHTALVVGSLDRSAEFYGALFDLQPLRRVRLRDHTIQYLSTGSETVLELIRWDEPVTDALDQSGHHLAFEVADVEAVEAKVGASDGTVVSRPNFMPELGFVSMMVRDPDGYLVEVIQRD